MLPISNKLDVFITNLRVRDTGTAIEDAAPKFNLYDSAGELVAGCENISLIHDAGGNYLGRATPTTSLTKGEMYEAVVTETTYGIEWREWQEAGERTFDR